MTTDTQRHTQNDCIVISHIIAYSHLLWLVVMDGVMLIAVEWHGYKVGTMSIDQYQ